MSTTQTLPEVAAAPDAIVAKANKPQAELLVRLANQMIEVHTGLVIDDPSVFEAVAADLKTTKNEKAKVEALRVTLKEPFLVGGRAVDAIFKPILDRFDEAVSTMEAPMIAYSNEQEKKRREEEARAQAAAAAERKRLEDEAREAQRKADEEAAELRRKAEEEAARLKATGDEKAAQEAKERAEREAREREARAEEEARVKRETAAATTAALPMTPKATAAGTSIPRPWKAEVTDLMALVRYVAEHPEFINLLEANETALNALAKSLKDKCNLPGVRVYQSATVRSR